MEVGAQSLYHIQTPARLNECQYSGTTCRHLVAQLGFEHHFVSSTTSTSIGLGYGSIEGTHPCSCGFFFLIKHIYLAALDRSCSTQDFHFGMWDLYVI